MRYLVLLCSVVWLVGCDPMVDGSPSGTTTAYVPTYMAKTSVADIGFKESRPTTKPGKIYVYGNFLFQNEQNEGIHVVDVSNPASPKKIGFLKVPLCTEIAIKNGFLYTNNYADMVVFNLTNPAGPQMVKRIANVFPPVNQEYPPFLNVAFECVDKSKGVVIGWELRDIPTPSCRR